MSFRGYFLSQESQLLAVSAIATLLGGLSVLELLEGAAVIEEHEYELGAQIEIANKSYVQHFRRG